MESNDFLIKLKAKTVELNFETPNIQSKLELISKYRDLLIEENKKQNLTRLLSSKDFIEGHVEDAINLEKSGFLRYPAMDLGSGGGVPGILCAIFDEKPWILAESEKRKAQFLENTLNTLKLSHVFVYAGRGEDYICEHSVQSIVVRAVAPVDKIYKWIKNCSTWNNLILFKGPKWPKPNAEWDLFSKKHSNRVLKIENKYHYQVGTAKKQRVIVNLIRSA